MRSHHGGSDEGLWGEDWDWFIGPVGLLLIFAIIGLIRWMCS